MADTVFDGEMFFSLFKNGIHVFYVFIVVYKINSNLNINIELQLDGKSKIEII